jgi:hypothetical protein
MPRVTDNTARLRIERGAVGLINSSIVILFDDLFTPAKCVLMSAELRQSVSLIGPTFYYELMKPDSISSLALRPKHPCSV